jgi:PRTRC genetic system ThiF family protein
MYKAQFHSHYENIVLMVGCGGTGGYVAEGLARILPENWTMILQDHDRVEEKNLIRQNFFTSDLGKFKSQALAERISVNFHRKIGYKILPIGVIASDLHVNPVIIIGCVDNAQARRAIHRTANMSWWIDAGNGHHSGQVLIGNAIADEIIKHSFIASSEQAPFLPAPSIQLPSILDPAIDELKLPDCATAVQTEEQSPVINQMMATIVLQAVHQLINNALTWMGSYVDLEAGTLSTVHIEPKTVARMCGVKVDTLMK